MASPLTRTKLEALARNPPRQRMDLADGQIPGLALRVTPQGTMTWSFQLRITGAGGVTGRGHKLKGEDRCRLSLGRFPIVPIAEARSLAARYADLGGRGIDPRIKLEEQSSAQRDTIEALAEQFTERYINVRKLRNAKKTAMAFKVHIMPAWGKRTAASITRKDCQAIVQATLPKKKVGKGGVYHGGHEASRCVRQVIHKMFQWACMEGLLPANPMSGVFNVTQKISRDRVLEMSELRALWQACDALMYPYGPLCRLLMLTACRRGEWVNARWSWINMQDKVMIIPSDSYKSARTHVVPLSDGAIEILQSIPRWNGGDYVFSQDNGLKPVSNFTHIKARLGRVVAKMLGRALENWTFHDFRRSAATHMRRIGVDRYVVKRILGHADRDVTSIYDRYDLMDERREALELWQRELSKN